MHRLHGYLVSIQEAAENGMVEIGQVNRESLARFLVRYTVYQTEHLETEFDARNFSAMGIWADTHPDPVVFASDDPDRFRKELERIREHQAKIVDEHLDVLVEAFSDDCTLVSLPACFAYSAAEGMEPHLLTMAKTLCGEYHIESGYYDTTRMTARLTLERVEEIMQNPDDFALVFIPLHR